MDKQNTSFITTNWPLIGMLPGLLMVINRIYDFTVDSNQRDGFPVQFFAFNAGTRSCLGKQLDMNLMKTVIVEILQNYDIHVIKGQKIEPLPGLILRMKHGLNVTITKRDSA
ncbi:hypothetical protein Bca52824_068442 [Brassica carinata]|uniref:Cytochrome P450 n=1 Tax=Brassica carinata TaxID=52824 RepID=A0A8X7Q3Q3_BRACI|nr:hypothetical protein Bca52824_068442 [Brassica carinata]